MLLEQLLQSFVSMAVTFSKAQDLKGLYLRHEAAFDAESLLSDLLSALVGELLGQTLLALLLYESQDLLLPIHQRYRSDDGMQKLIVREEQWEVL